MQLYRLHDRQKATSLYLSMNNVMMQPRNVLSLKQQTDRHVIIQIDRQKAVR